jgi:DNA-binding SARP family transcriptional activator
VQQTADDGSPKNSRYEDIAELLREARTSCERMGDEFLIGMVEAAYRTSRACSQAMDEVEWHRQAYSRVRQRHQQLLQELSALVNLIGVPALSSKYRQHDVPSLGGAEQAPTVNDTAEEYERLVHSIKDLLGPLSCSETMSQKTGQACEQSSELIRVEAGESVDISPASLIEGADEGAQPGLHSLAVYFLSPFRVLLDEQPVAGWPNCKGKSIFKYLVTHRERPIPKEVLMEIFWPEIDPDASRNNLNVAIYGLRKALSKVNADFPYVLFQEGCYLLNPDLQIWVDAEAFMGHVRRAREFERCNNLAGAIHEYRAAEAIYQSEFLIEDRYEEWLTGARQNFLDTYLAVMNRLSCYYYDQQDYEACVTICTKTLADDSCNEEIHRRLMRCYSLMGYTHLGLRQYHVCRESLARELNITPSKETMQLFEQIRQRQSV